MIGILLALFGPLLIVAGIAGKLLDGSPIVEWLPFLSSVITWLSGSFHWFIGAGIFVYMIVNTRNPILSGIVAAVAALAAWFIGGMM